MHKCIENRKLEKTYPVNHLSYYLPFLFYICLKLQKHVFLKLPKNFNCGRNMYYFCNQKSPWKPF